mgnify:CR=1 FL=1|jgi:hypothetical protein
MGLQKQVNLYRAAGVQGDKATPNQSIYFPKQMVAEGAVTVGTFVFYGTDASKQASNSKTGGTAADIIGFVERVINYANYDVTSKGTLIVPNKSTLTIAMCGDYWATATTAATPRQKVFVNPTTGAISTAAAGETVKDAVKTPWTVIQGGEAGTPILISNWTHVNVAAAKATE